MSHRPTRHVLSITVVAAVALAATTSTTVLGRGPGPAAGSCLDDQRVVQRPIRAQTSGEGRAQARTQAATGRSWAGLRTRPARRSTGDTQKAAGRQTQRGPEACGTCQLELGTLTDEQIATLRFMANEEKLAHDVYVALGQSHDLSIFATIAASEAQHLSAVDNLMDRYGVADSPAALPQGEFTDASIAELYSALVARGSSSVDEAIAVGILIEQDDLQALSDGLEGLEVSAPDVFRVYSNLQLATQRHQAAFEAAA